MESGAVRLLFRDDGLGLKATWLGLLDSFQTKQKRGTRSISHDTSCTLTQVHDPAF
jgi:hypothetical protein